MFFSLLQIQALGPQGAGALQAAGAHHGGRPHIPLRSGGDGRRAASSAAATTAAAIAATTAAAAATDPSDEAEVGEPVPSGQAAPPPLQEEEKEGEREGTTFNLKWTSTQLFL